MNLARLVRLERGGQDAMGGVGYIYTKSNTF